MFLFYNLLVLLTIIPILEACHPRFEKELRYLDLYLGIQPDNGGEIPSKDAEQHASYIPSSESLDCDFESECLWKNAPSDGLLDTSDFWYFKKTDDKILPVQIQPGRADIPKGSHLLLAGNTSSVADGAVIVSAPVACQRSPGNLKFHYWLYNQGRIEVIVIRATHRRRRIQTLFRPRINCHILRPGNDVCTVQIPIVKVPFRLAIRAFNLKDNVVGSMVMLKNITYRAETCAESPFPSIFGSIPLIPQSSTLIKSFSELDCDRPRSKCRWSNAESTVSEWRIGRNVDGWSEFMEVGLLPSHPTSTFLFLAVDSLSPRRYATLRSELIPCTQTTTTLSMKYWLKAGTQVEVCAVDIEGVALSCAYLSEEDSPGPIEIDVDAYNQPFRFTLEMIAFDESSIGLVVISEIHLKGLLCSEEPPPVVTTIDPPTIASLFGLQQGPGPNVPYSLDLSCDFSQDHCSQWVNDDGLVSYGVVPMNSKKFPFLHPNHIMSISASSEKPFEFSIVAASRKNAVVVISSISTSGYVCTLKTAEELMCSKILCPFNEHLCNYESVLEKEDDVPLTIGPLGAVATIGKGKHRAILRSARFYLISTVVLNITVTQATYGSRVLLCPDSTSDFESCHELLGPRVEKPIKRSVLFQLDDEAHQFAVVLFHDKAEQFGPAQFTIHSIDLKSADGAEICQP
ncbi:unnamed protein product [Angiostrongylus costaricensis]|uniref:MAM domain-containing protein n=1 Tax=Angiostrongylus costaricensis TaxID=334426 RepID=A0A158PGW0_ANGCS|nr:unnamed protein product [Angiostrongylus costaricensis]